MNNNKTQIMIVEDEVLVGIMLARKLRTFGYQVADVATTGEEAIERAGSELPQVILMDVTLAGEMDGLQAASCIKRKYGIPIIIFSGYDHALIDEETEQIQPVAILSKMGSVSEITDAIEKAVNK